MRANELMIGDWVHMKAHRGFEAQDIKVETIPDASSDTHYGHIGAFPTSEDMDFRDIEDTFLEPIQLTIEILEKNGFSKFIAGQYLCANKEEDWFVLVMPGLHTAPNSKHRFLASCKHIYTDAKIAINYVHELQHALRLCGINKEITL